MQKIVARCANKRSPVVLLNRVPTGDCVLSKDCLEKGCTAAGSLSPPKSRILLQLALAKTSDPKEIARIFREY